MTHTQNISVITTITKNFVDYVLLMRETGEKLKSKKHNIKWYFVASCDDIEYVDGFQKLGFVEKISQWPSKNHAAALNSTYDNLPDSDITVIIEADVIFLHKDWDDIVVKELSTIDIFSVDFPEKQNRIRYRNYPSVFFLCMKTELYKQLNIDFSSNKIDGIKYDTGYKIPNYIKNHTFKLLENIDKHQTKKLVLCDNIQEWYYNNKLFVTHFCKGRKIDHPKYKKKFKSWKYNSYQYIFNENHNNIQLTLDDIAIKYNTDKSSLGHNYTKFYSNIFNTIKHKKIILLELGIFRHASIKMWNEYFINGKIIGVDKNLHLKYDKNYVNRNNVFLEQSDHTNMIKMLSICQKYGPFDIIIDDGSHTSSSHLFTFEHLFPHIKPNGYLIIEDIHTIDKSYKRGKYIDTKHTILDILNNTPHINFITVDSLDLKTYIPNGLLCIKK